MNHRDTATLRTQLMHRLALCGTWANVAELEAVAPFPVMRAVLQELVDEGRVDYREHSGWRLAGTAAARRAAQQLMSDLQLRGCAVGLALNDGYHLGVAERRPVCGFVMYELLLPQPPLTPGALDAVIQFCESRGVTNGRL
jgi:hypothetical protein